MQLVRVCGSKPLNLTHAWWYTLWPVWPTINDTPLLPLGMVEVMWALPITLFGQMGDCFIYLFILYP